MAKYHVAATDAQGRLTAPSVLSQIDARTKATMRADLPALAEELKIGGGSGVEQVSGTVTLDASGAPIREVYATGAATVQGESLAAGDAAVFRRLNGSWSVMVVGKDTKWRAVGAVVEDPGTGGSLPAPNVTVTATADGAVISWTAVPGATGYSIRVDGGPWTSLTTTSRTITGQSAASQHTVEVTATNGTATSPVASKTYTVLGATQQTVTEYFNAQDGTPLTSLTGGLSWAAPAGESGVSATTGLVRGRSAGAVPGTSQFQGGKFAYVGDVRVTARYRVESHGQIRFHIGGKSAQTTLNFSAGTGAGAYVNDMASPVQTCQIRFLVSAR